MHMMLAEGTKNVGVSGQAAENRQQFRIGPLGNPNQVITALGKTIRAMAAGEIDSQTGARICNALGIMRTCLETAALERIEQRLDELYQPAEWLTL
jgi:hypothetical protein